MECDPDYAYIIADGYEFSERIETCNIIVEFPDETIVVPRVKYCHIDNGILGILCITEVGKTFDTNLVKGINVCHQLQMSERVHVYEGFSGRLSSGNVT